VEAYASEDTQANSDTLQVSPNNPCLSCHNPNSTHSRWSADGQITAGPQVGFGANFGVSLTDSSKVSVNVGATAIIGVSMTVTENSNAGTPAMPIITVDTTGVQVDSTQ
jgi:hypothetical protein